MSSRALVLTAEGFALRAPVQEYAERKAVQLLRRLPPQLAPVWVEVRMEPAGASGPRFNVCASIEDHALVHLAQAVDHDPEPAISSALSKLERTLVSSGQIPGTSPGRSAGRPPGRAVLPA